jgi:WhiB family redox-sensing transcriptional regulator
MLAISTLEPELLAGPVTPGMATAASADVSFAVDPWAKARCRDGNGTLAHLFFSEDALTIARAKAICSKCPLTERCLAGAIERAEPWGVWGGQLLVDGVPVAHKRGRGRPPKHPRPALVVDEVPVPPRRIALAPERVA